MSSEPVQGSSSRLSELPARQEISQILAQLLEGEAERKDLAERCRQSEMRAFERGFRLADEGVQRIVGAAVSGLLAIPRDRKVAELRVVVRAAPSMWCRAVPERERAGDSQAARPTITRS